MKNDQEQKARDLQKEMNSLAEIITRFATKIQEQEQMTDCIMQNAEVSTKHVKEANVQLDQAKDLVNEYSHIWIFIFCLLACLILFYDWMKS